jgi:transaldolase
MKQAKAGLIMISKLAQLKTMTTVVADTGDVEAIQQWHPEDATTNPSLLLKASELKTYQPLLQDCIAAANEQSSDKSRLISLATDLFAVRLGVKILDVIPGKISTEVDARLSFDTEATIAKARQIIQLYRSLGIDTSERVLIKIASTWEGIKAAEILEKEGIHCNLTLLFSFWQAVAAAEANAFLISPFVGRILDWYKKSTGKEAYASHEDPGVLSVQRVYRYYKSQGYNTVVMGASFRNTGEIEALAGCDRLTISPALLSELDADQGTLSQQLRDTDKSDDEKYQLSEADFRWRMNEDAMATEKLAEGIRNFAADQNKLEAKLSSFL